MARNSALNFNLPSADDLFSTEEERAEARLEKVVNLSPAEISDFPNHPFKVRMDAAMQEMAESVKQYGVLVPTLVRPKRSGGYEMVAGHRRKKAADLAGLAEIPCIVRQLTDDEATIIMVDSNLQREQILPSEKAFAYKMKLDAMKRQGQRTDLTSGPVGQKSSRDELADTSPDSSRQIQRYIRLTHLIPEILELVDNSVLKDPDMLQIAMRPAVELSYLRKEEQADLFAIMDEMDCTPSHAQAIKMRRMSEAKTGAERLSKDAMAVIMEEEKGNQKEQFKIPKEKISRFFAPGTPTQKIEDTIVKALELYRKRQRSLER
jgi:ParB family chromosome partitioning protein